MRSTGIVVGIASVVAVAALSLALYEIRMARASAAEGGVLGGELRTVTARNIALQREVAQLRAAQVAATLPATAVPAKKDSPATTSAGGRADDPLTNPEARGLHFQKVGADLELSARPFLTRLGFSGEQWEKYRALVIEELEVEMDVEATARAHGLSTKEQEALLMQDATKARENLHALLGSDETYKQLIQWNQELALRNTAGELAGKLLYSDEPLTGEQAQQFVKIVTGNQGLQGRVGQEVVFIADPAMAQLQALLSPAQFAVLQQQQLAHRAALQIAALAKR